MKLHELLREDNIKHVQVKYLPNMVNAEKIGSGFEAEVYAGKDGASVIKELWIKESIETNATYQYIDMVMSHQDNPYFPRIYNAKLYTTKRDDNSHSKLIIQMEKLMEFDTSKTEHLMPQLIEQLGITADDMPTQDTAVRMRNIQSGSHHIDEPSDMKANKEVLRKLGVESNAKVAMVNDRTPEQDAVAKQRSEEYDRKNMLRDIGRVLFDMFRTQAGREELMQKSSNTQLKEAIKLTSDIILKGEKGNEEGSGRITKGDLHDGNIMIRLTSVGPQLVITDPVISRGV